MLNSDSHKTDYYLEITKPISKVLLRNKPALLYSTTKKIH